MAKTSGDFEKELLDTAKEKTGKSVNDWLGLIKKSGIKKPAQGGIFCGVKGYSVFRSFPFSWSGRTPDKVQADS